MATFYADNQSIINAQGQGVLSATRVKVTKLQGKLRLLEAVFINNVGAAIGDKIVWGKLPLKSRLLGHLSKIYFDAGAASSTLNLGDSIVAARHLAATSVASAGSAVPEASANVNTATANTTSGSATIQIASSPGAFQVGNKIVGTGIPTGATIVSVESAKVGSNVVISAAATATGTGVTMTVTGDGYEVTDDSNSVANSFGSTTDDATLISTVAGAALGANQVITLKAVYVQE